MGPSATEISTIEHLILLDLLGAPNPSIRSFFLDTGWLFDAIASAEYRLGESGAFAYGKQTGMDVGKWKSWFKKRTGYEMNLGYVGDYHVPFLRKGVSVLHLISEPFPSVWHTLRVREVVPVSSPELIGFFLLFRTTRRLWIYPPCVVGISFCAYSWLSI